MNTSPEHQHQQQHPHQHRCLTESCPLVCCAGLLQGSNLSRRLDGCLRSWDLRSQAEAGGTTATCLRARAAVDRNGPRVSTSSLSRQDDQGPARRGQANAGAEYCELSSDEEVALARGLRPPCLGEPPGSQARVQRHTVEQMVECFAPVLLLDHDVPGPQLVDQLVGVLQGLDMSTLVE